MDINQHIGFSATNKITSDIKVENQTGKSGTINVSINNSEPIHFLNENQVSRKTFFPDELVLDDDPDTNEAIKEIELMNYKSILEPISE